MNRKVKVCMLYADQARNASLYLTQRISQFTSEIEASNYEDATALASGVDTCAREGGIVFAAAPLSVFLNAKLRLIKTVSSKIVRSNSISAAMGENAPENPKERDLQAAIPEKAKTIKTADGLYSAFIKDYGKSIIIFLPLDAERIGWIFDSGLSTLLEKMFPNATPQKPVPTERSGMAAMRKSVETVIGSGKTVAISPYGCSKPLISAISSVPDCETAFVFDNALRDRLPDESIENYAAQCAKISKENSGTDLGISISPIYKDKTDDSDFVIVCVADSERAKAAKVYGNTGEERKHLVAAAVIRLCKMLGELTQEERLVNPNVPVASVKKWSKNSKLPILLTAVGVALAVVICVIIAFALGDNNDRSASTDFSSAANYEFVRQEGYFADVDYYGGSDIEDLKYYQAVVMETEASTSEIMTVPVQSTVTTTAIKIITTIKNVLTTKQTTTTTTAPIVTAKPTTTTAPTTTVMSTTTTTKITTTLKPTTTAAPSTTAAESSKVDSTTSGSSTGTFVFKVYGFGHGVGMSQDGAIQMAKDGKTYEEIVTHYYTGTTVKVDSSTPLKVKYGGKEIPIVEYLCKTTYREIGGSAPMEALKAQVVTAYTYAKYYEFDVQSSKHAYSESYEYEGTNIHKACLAVLGMSSDSDTPKARYVDYNGSAAFTCYFASAAGKTVSSSSIWGGENIPYLCGGVSSPEEVTVTDKTITAEEMKKYILSYAKDNKIEITLDDDPAEWLKIISHDASMNENVGYVTKMKVGNAELNGNIFRSYVIDYAIKSHCFTVEYIPAKTE